jgi:hypothetical protein
MDGKIVAGILLPLLQPLYGKADTDLHSAKGIRQVFNLILRFDLFYLGIDIT